MGILFQNCNFKIPVMLFQSLHVFGIWSGKKGEGIGWIETNNAKQTLELKFWKAVRENLTLYIEYKILHSKPTGLSVITEKYSFHTDPSLGIILVKPLEVPSFYLQAKPYAKLLPYI